jgi:thiol-disulfide isomerase/thioredoxin
VSEKSEEYATLLIIGVIILMAVIATIMVVRDTRQITTPIAESLQDGDGVAAYTDLLGNPMTLTSYVGKVIVVNSWASWSPESSRELPLLATIVKEYTDREVVVLAINRAEPQSTAERYLRTVGAADGVQLILDPDDHYYKSIGGYAMPETIFYDTKGNIVQHHHGVLTEAKIRTFLEETLEASQ